MGGYFDHIVRRYPSSPALIVRHEAPDIHSPTYAGGALINEECLRWNYSQFSAHADALARGLLRSGLKKGDRIGAVLGNSSAYCLLQLATARTGIILACINPAAGQTELLAALNLSGCSALFVVPSLKRSNFLATLKNMLPSLTTSPSLNESPLFSSRKHITSIEDSECPSLRSIFVCDNTPLGADGFGKFLGSVGFGSDFRELMEWEGVGITGVDRLSSPNDIINMQFTSGTTGASKAVSLTHRNLLNNGILVAECMDLQLPSLTFAGEVLANIPPMFHCFGIVLGNLAVWSKAGCIVFPNETFDPALTLRAVIQEKCSALHGVPTMFLAELALLDKLDAGEDVPGLSDLSDHTLHLRTGIAAGSPVPDELMRRLVSRLRLKDLVITYGMTETSPATVMSRTTDSVALRCTTVGRVLPHTAIRIVDPAHPLYPDESVPSVPVGVSGELWSAGYALQTGYWNNQSETDKVHFTDKDGLRWIRTGDQAIMNEEGYISIVGRIKDIIIRGGENLFPVVIENKLLQNDAVFDCAVIAVPCPRFLEVPAVFVIRAPTPAGAALTRQSIAEYVSSNLSHQSKPEWVWFLGEDTAQTAWPTTASGKIRKVELREWGKELLGKKVGRVVAEIEK